MGTWASRVTFKVHASAALRPLSERRMWCDQMQCGKHGTSSQPLRVKPPMNPKPWLSQGLRMSPQHDTVLIIPDKLQRTIKPKDLPVGCIACMGLKAPFHGGHV